MSECHKLISITVCIPDTNFSISIEEIEELLDENHIWFSIDDGIVFIRAIDFLKSSNILYREIDGVKEIYALRRLLSSTRHRIYYRYPYLMANLSEVLLEASSFI